MKSYCWSEQKRLNLLGLQRLGLTHNQEESACHTHFNQKELPSSTLIYFSMQSPELVRGPS